jgi:hypothetical protein
VSRMLDLLKELTVTTDRRALLRALRVELAFVESGAYRNPSHAAWRPQFVFQDSPTCLNRNYLEPRRPCSECVLSKLFSLDSRVERVPCRCIPLNQAGETIDSLYRTGTQEELEVALVEWLKTTVERLESEEPKEWRSDERPVLHVRAKFDSKQLSAPEPSMLSVCANPQCRAAFFSGEGRFFRFRLSHNDGNAANTHAVEHFWLCGKCSQRFTLGFRDGVGVVIQNRPDVALEADISRPMPTPQL